MTFLFAWALPGEAFGPQHLVEDEDVYSFDLTQVEGDFATLQATVRNPRIGLLSVTRRVWAWFSYTPDGVVFYPLFYGRLVAIPSDILGELVMLDFVARPGDFRAQKETLAATMRDLPHYDPIWLSEEEQANPDTVLNARSAHWHTDRVTHVLSTSDVLTGEDGELEFQESDILYNSVKISVSGIPISTVRVKAIANWRQSAVGSIVLDQDAVIETHTPDGLISRWPEAEDNIGEGWFVTDASIRAVYDFTVTDYAFQTHHTPPTPEEMGSATEAWTYNTSITRQTIPDVKEEAGLGYISDHEDWIFAEPIVTEHRWGFKYDDQMRLQSSFNSRNWSNIVIPVQRLITNLSVGFDPDRKQAEEIVFDVTADLQPLVTLPDGQDILDLGFESVDLSLPLTLDDSIPIGDPRRRSYVTQPRGHRSLEYCMLVARAHIRSNARAVRIGFEVKEIELFIPVTLRKTGRVHDPRLPGGEAVGKITTYSLNLQGSTGRLSCGITVECAVGRGGVVAADPGEPTWADESWAGNDWQEYSGVVAVLGDDIEYEIPTFASGDDGIDFIGSMHAQPLYDSGVIVRTVTNPASVQAPVIINALSDAAVGPAEEAARMNTHMSLFQDQARITGDGIQFSPQHTSGKEVLEKVAPAIEAAMEEFQTVVKWQFKPLDGEFLSNYTVVVHPIYVPRMIDLESE